MPEIDAHRQMDLRVDYANHAAVGGTSTDAVILFSVRTPEPAGESAVEQHKAVHVPWEVATALAKMLVAAAERYEQDHGAIPDVTGPDKEPDDDAPGPDAVDEDR